jgi:gliding motility-associated-like protein
LYKPFLYCILFCLLGSNIVAQNLVPNPSFEDTVYCPTTISQFDAVANWFNPSSGETPDYYNECSNILPPNFNLSGAGVPNNNFGYQFAQNGKAYAGIVTYDLQPTYREYVAVQLEENLIEGKEYNWCIYISLLERANFASNNIGIAISNNLIPNFLFTTLAPYVYGNNTEVIYDHANWTKISGSFIAQGGEKYLYIGNFFDNSNTQVFRVNNLIGIGEYSVYYIDNVYLGIDPCPFEEEINLPNIFTPNGDGDNDLFKVMLNYDNYIIYNRWGQKIFETNELNKFWDGKTQKGDDAPDGMYYYVIQGKNINKSGFVHLLR